MTHNCDNSDIIIHMAHNCDTIATHLTRCCLLDTIYRPFSFNLHVFIVLLSINIILPVGWSLFVLLSCLLQEMISKNSSPQYNIIDS